MKWFGWILKLCVTIVAVSLLTVATTGYIVNSYIQSLLRSYNLPITAEAPGFGGIMKGMLGLDGSSGSVGTTTETNGTPASGKDPGTEGKDANTTGENAPEDALPVMGGMSAGEALGEDQQVVVTPDDLVARKKELPDQQKEEIFAILMKKLPQEEMQMLTVALEGGLTETEMINIEQVLSKHLDKTEYAKVMELLKK